MRPIFSFFFVCLSISLFAQWQPLDIPKSTRYDDVFFIDELTGWAVGGGAKTIHKTTNGGQTWTLKFQSPSSPDYLRSIEFVSASIGYAGSLNGRLYQTLDGGETWENIATRVPVSLSYLGSAVTSLPGICGLAAPSENVTYGTGIWNNGPAYVIKTTDGGQNWVTFDLSGFATQLVDILFLDENEGYVTGRANPISDGGIILHTVDGGANWEVVHKTMTSGDYIWKIQSPDGLHYFGSIQSLPYTANVRFVKSTDAGANWSTLPVSISKWYYIQMIGFKDELTGWTGGTANGGGETMLYETTDGGSTWRSIPVGCNSTFNRFFRINENSIYMTGTQVYKYDPDYVQTGLCSDDGPHVIFAYPNPTRGELTVKVNIEIETRCALEVIDLNGKVIQTLHNGFISAGSHVFPVQLERGGLYFAVLHTNEGLNYVKIATE